MYVDVDFQAASIMEYVGKLIGPPDLELSEREQDVSDICVSFQKEAKNTKGTWEDVMPGAPGLSKLNVGNCPME